MNENKKLNSNKLLKIDLRTGLINYRKQSRPLEHIQIKDNNKITLVDIIR